MTVIQNSPSAIDTQSKILQPSKKDLGNLVASFKAIPKKYNLNRIRTQQRERQRGDFLMTIMS